MTINVQWTKSSLQLATTGGMLVALGFSCSAYLGLFVHLGEDSDQERTWYVTHIPSGKALSRGWATLDGAKAMAKLMCEGGLHWDVSEREIATDERYKVALKAAEATACGGREHTKERKGKGRIRRRNENRGILLS